MTTLVTHQYPASAQPSKGGSPITYHYSRITILLFALCCFGLSPAPQAFGVSPAPDGGYSGGNTAEGDSALFKLTTGTYNTANGLQALFSDTTGVKNTANGAFALPSNTTGNNNAANGFAALYNNTTGNNNTANGGLALYNNTTADNNTANGLEALFSNTTGNNNTANGLEALFSITTGNNNTANGAFALSANTAGDSNTANGHAALYNNTTGNNNTADGVFALYNNTTGDHNAANGFLALFSNTTGFGNVATGSQALYNNTTGIYNMANGFQALYSNDTGNQNTANGIQALFHNTSGFNNTAYGFQALEMNTTGQINTAIGYNALFNNTGAGNIGLGQAAGFNLTTGNENIDIGNQGVMGESDTIRIGDSQTATFIAGISGATVAGGVGVIIDTNGQLGTVLSSERFKDEIKPMDKASEAILALKPVTFRYKHELDPKGIPQFGLVAEEVEKVNPALVARDGQGKVYTVRYEAVNAMLLNEFLKQHRIVQEQQAEIKALAAQLKEQAALLQKVSNRLELNKPAPQMAVNNQ